MTTTGFAGKKGIGWSLLASWLIPVMMTGAYIVLAVTSETDHTGQAWMSIGLAFVLILWWLFRLLTEHAALSRAVAVGDADRILELTDKQLNPPRWVRKRGAGDRARLQIFRALAYETRGDWQAALDAVSVTPVLSRQAPTLGVEAACIRVAAYVETGRVDEARRILDATITPAAARLDRRTNPVGYVNANLARGRVRWAEGAFDEAADLFQRVIDDVRAGSGQRAVAHFYVARCDDARGNTNGAAAHRAKAAQLLPGSWVARQPS
ncbi:MAG: hypothetical protein JWO36_4705 [Myxococcales bacterium]|nr:hypothetical protein [Myxococcales bacterium]